MNKILKGVLLGGFLLGLVPMAHAGDFTATTQITNVRSYQEGSYFVTVQSSALAAGGTCTTVYKVNGAASGAKTIIATLLTAKATDRNVRLEMATGCPDGWGSEIISVIVY